MLRTSVKYISRCHLNL